MQKWCGVERRTDMNIQEDNVVVRCEGREHSTQIPI